MVKILVVDDEAPARERLHSLVEELGPPYEWVGEAANGEEALVQSQVLGVDLVLMDVQMPAMDGLQAAAQLAEQDEPPSVIFVTAYEEHALAAFDSNAVDYLLKPIRRQRLERALARATALTRPQLQALQVLRMEEADYVATLYRGGIRQIPLEEILYFRAEQKYVTLRHVGGEALLEESLKSLEQRFSHSFMRVHRNALVSRRYIQGLEKMPDGRCLVRLEGAEEGLEVSRRHLAQVRRWLKRWR